MPSSRRPIGLAILLTAAVALGLTASAGAQVCNPQVPLPPEPLPEVFDWGAPGFRSERGYPGDQIPPRDETLSLAGAVAPSAVTLMSSGRSLPWVHRDGVLTVQLPAALRGPLVDVAQVELAVIESAAQERRPRR
jgi:hypothetical protein